MSKIERISQALEELYLSGAKLRDLRLPVIMDILDYETLKEAHNPNTYREFNYEETKDRFIIRSYRRCFDKNNTDIEDLEMYTVTKFEKGYKIDIGKRGPLRKGGIRVCADLSGTMIGAVFILDIMEKIPIVLPTPNNKMSDLEKFIKFQRDLERIEDKEYGQTPELELYSSVAYSKKKGQFGYVKEEIGPKFKLGLRLLKQVRKDSKGEKKNEK